MVYLTDINLNGNELQNAVLQPLAIAPSTPKLGQIYTDSTNSKIKWYDGSVWKTIGVVVESSAANGSIVVDGTVMQVYELPRASAAALGGVRIGAGLSVDPNGVLSVAAGGVADSVEWAGVLNKPTNLSDFVNDEDFIDNTVSNLVNYYTKSETYTQSQVNNLIGQIATIQISVVNELPASGTSNVIYLIPKVGGEAPNAKDEYLWTGTSFEKIGDTVIDLTNYLQKNGDGSSVKASFSTAVSRVLPASGESIAIIVGKISKYLTDLAPVAFTGNYASLTNRPETYIHHISNYLHQGNTSATIAIDPLMSLGGIISVVLRGAVSRESIVADWDLNSDGEVVVTISEAFSEDIVVTVYFTKNNDWSNP